MIKDNNTVQEVQRAKHRIKMLLANSVKGSGTTLTTLPNNIYKKMTIQEFTMNDTLRAGLPGRCASALQPKCIKCKQDNMTAPHGFIAPYFVVVFDILDYFTAHSEEVLYYRTLEFFIDGKFVYAHKELKEV